MVVMLVLGVFVSTFFLIASAPSKNLINNIIKWILVALGLLLVILIAWDYYGLGSR